jgi:hypothetical protein
MCSPVCSRLPFRPCRYWLQARCRATRKLERDPATRHEPCHEPPLTPGPDAAPCTARRGRPPTASVTTSAHDVSHDVENPNQEPPGAAPGELPASGRAAGQRGLRHDPRAGGQTVDQPGADQEPEPEQAHEHDQAQHDPPGAPLVRRWATSPTSTSASQPSTPTSLAAASSTTGRTTTSSHRCCSGVMATTGSWRPRRAPAPPPSRPDTPCLPNSLAISLPSLPSPVLPGPRPAAIDRVDQSQPVAARARGRRARAWPRRRSRPSRGLRPADQATGAVGRPHSVPVGKRPAAGQRYNQPYRRCPNALAGRARDHRPRPHRQADGPVSCVIGSATDTGGASKIPSESSSEDLVGVLVHAG